MIFYLFFPVAKKIHGILLGNYLNFVAINNWLKGLIYLIMFVFLKNNQLYNQINRKTQPNMNDW